MGRTMAAAFAALCIAGALPARADGPSAPTGVVKTYTGTLPPVWEGRRVFLKLNCYGCHGDRAAGGMGPNIRQAESADLTDVVKNGGNGMPPFGRYLNATDTSNLLAYLNSVGTANEPRFFHWWEAVPSQ